MLAALGHVRQMLLHLKTGVECTPYGLDRGQPLEMNLSDIRSYFSESPHANERYAEVMCWSATAVRSGWYCGRAVIFIHQSDTADSWLWQEPLGRLDDC